MVPGIHKNPTIAFRPSEWERHMIETRAELSGQYKKDFIARSCIYSNIVVVGKKENIKRMVDAVYELQYSMKEIAEQLQCNSFGLTEDGYQEFRGDCLALAVTVVDILNGAAYLFDKIPENDNQHWKADIRLDQLGRIIQED